ncbi:MFS transporter [Fulvimonas yonginensis]|uniref:MFS transporter n=1 Tax=Fulvimonas yonginensis TaxID=1495200 RepID=A0ABU8JBN4_9GAMM
MSAASRTPPALYALAAGAFGIGTTEFVIMGLLLQVARDLHVGVAAAGLLISGYALGVFVGAPLLTAATGRLSRKAVLLGLMAIFTLGNLACALAPSYATLMAARVVTSLAHGTFFGVGSVVATGLVVAERRASAISLMFTGLTLATLLGVPAGTWLGHLAGWRATFWAVAAVGVVALAVIAARVPADHGRHATPPLRAELRAIAQPSVLLGLATTVLGFGGVFTVFTYVQPLLTRMAGFPDRAVPPILLLLGMGLIVGNLLGGRLADRRLGAALVGTLLALAAVLAFTGLALHARLPALLAMGLFGIAAFATVAPLQLWVLHEAAGAPNLASSLNIGAFNLGNAFGAWLGGVVIEHGTGLAAVPFAGALVTLGGAAVALAGLRAARPAPVRLAACER